MLLATGVILLPAVAGDGRVTEALRHAERARRLTQQGSFAGALREWQAAIRLLPSRADFHNLHGLALEMAGRGEKARPEFVEALRLDPSYVDARINLAYSLLKASRKEEAGKEFDAALKLKPSDPVLHLERGLIDAGAGRSVSACLHFRQGRPWPEDKSTAWMIFGACLASNRVEEAVEAARLFAEDGRSQLQIGQLLLQSGRPAEALHFLEKARLDASLSPQASLSLAEAYLGACRARDALATLEALRSDAESHYRIRELRGSALLAMGEEREAQAQFNKLVEENPNIAEAYVDATQILLQQKKWDEALRILNQGLQQMPENWRLLFRRGIAYKLSGDLEQARISLTQALEQEGDVTLAAAALGEVIAGMGDLGGAAELFRRTYQQTRNPRFRLAYAMVLEKMGDETKAMRELEAFKTEMPANAQARFLLGKLYEHEGRMQDAEHEFEEARRRDARLAPNLYALGRLYASSGQRGKAAAVLADFEKFRRGVAPTPCDLKAAARP